MVSRDFTHGYLKWHIAVQSAPVCAQGYVLLITGCKGCITDKVGIAGQPTRLASDNREAAVCPVGN